MMKIFVQIMVTVAFIAMFFLGVILAHKKNKLLELSEEERGEQKKKIYAALKEIVRSDNKGLIDEVSEKIDLREGDSLDEKP